MAVSYGAAGAFAYSAQNGTSVAPAYPTGITAGQMLVLFVAMKPSTANSGTVTTPAGWTSVGGITGAGGYGTTLGADTGNTNIFVYTKKAVGNETGSLTVTVGTNNVCVAQIMRFTTSLGDWAPHAIATGSQAATPTTSLSVATTAGIDIAANDAVLALFSTPTDVTTPSQYSAQGFTHTGTTFGTRTEIGEWDSGTGNDMGGVATVAQATAGGGSGTFTFTATLAGTLTNVRGPLAVLRLRDMAPVTLVVQNAAHTQSAGSPTLTQIVNTTLTTQAAAHTQAAGNVALVQQHTLVVANARGNQTAGSPTLTQTHNLVVQSSAHAQAASSPGTFLQYSQLTVANARSNQTAGNVSLTQVHNLTVANARGAQVAGNVTLTQVHNLSSANARSLQTAGSPTLAVTSYLVVQNARSLQAAEGDLILVQRAPNVVDLIVQNPSHTQTAATLLLTQVITMTGLANASHAQTASGPVLQHVQFIPQVFGAVHHQKAGHVALVQNSTLQVEDCRHYHEAHPIRLSQFAVAYLFVTPTEPSIVFTDERLVSYLRPPGGVTLLLEGGIVSEVQFPTQDQVSAADMAYVGGHEYTVSEEAAQVLRDAGYTANLYETLVEV
jgi:hypothetical protein